MNDIRLTEAMMKVLDAPISAKDREREVTPHERKIVVRSLEKSLKLAE